MQILLGGDSAGGNLAAALLQHIAHPHPEVARVTLARPLHAALLISPWVSFRDQGATFDSNAESDYITSKAVRRAASAYIAPGTQHDYYSEPATAPPEWWVDVATGTLRHMYIWAGGGEVLLGGIRSFADKVGAGFARAAGSQGPLQQVHLPCVEKQDDEVPRFVFVTTPKAAHEEMIIDEVFMVRKKREGAQEIEKWLSAVL